MTATPGPGAIAVAHPSAASVAVARPVIETARVVSAAQQGPTGAVGPNVPTASLVAETDIAAGQPVFIDRGSRLLGLAQADIYARRACVGLARADIAGGLVGAAEGKVLTLDDWTAATGAPALFMGATYFLACAPGLLSTSPPPLDARGCSIVRVGIATSAQTLAILHAPPYLL